MVFDPLASDVVDRLAEPFVSCTVPKILVPDLKVTDPVGTPDVLDVTVAVNVTDWPTVDGFSEEVKAVFVAAFPTTWEIAGDVLVALLASPLYTTVIVCVPTVRVETLRVAAPPLNVCVPNVAAPFLKVTVPVGVPPEADVTVAVKVTPCPKFEGLPLDVTVAVVLYLLTVSVSVAEVLGENVAFPE
jgi:hypothetical protein